MWSVAPTLQRSLSCRCLLAEGVALGNGWVPIPSVMPGTAWAASPTPYTSPPAHMVPEAEERTHVC